MNPIMIDEIKKKLNNDEVNPVQLSELMTQIMRLDHSIKSKSKKTTM
jgi:hypothetical protein